MAKYTAVEKSEKSKKENRNSDLFTVDAIKNHEDIYSFMTANLLSL